MGKIVLLSFLYLVTIRTENHTEVMTVSTTQEASIIFINTIGQPNCNVDSLLQCVDVLTCTENGFLLFYMEKKKVNEKNKLRKIKTNNILRIQKQTNKLTVNNKIYYLK
jgi:hypothetical protein